MLLWCVGELVDVVVVVLYLVFDGVLFVIGGEVYVGYFGVFCVGDGFECVVFGGCDVCVVCELGDVLYVGVEWGDVLVVDEGDLCLWVCCELVCGGVVECE